MKQKYKGVFLLLLTSFIWGTAFVAQRKGMEFIGPFTFNGIRSFIGAAVLLPLVAFSIKSARAISGDLPNALQAKGSKRSLAIGGLLCGILMFTASSLQQYGMVYTTSGKAGFITAMYIVIVPLLGVFIGKKIRPLLWVCVAIAVLGLFLLTIKEDFSLNRGDIFVMVCALFFSVHILVIDYFSPRTNPIALSQVQLLITGLLSIPFILGLETVNWSSVLECWFPIFYAGVMSCGVAYTLQIVAQRHTEPTVASLLLSLESVFAVLAGAIILGEVLNARELVGCILMFVAIVLSQLPDKNVMLKKKGNQS